MTAPEAHAAVATMPVFDHTDPSFMSDIHAKLADTRQSCPVVHSPRFGGFYAVLGHADVADAANDYERFTPTGGITIPKFELPTRSLPLESDPPEHGLYRRVLQPFFTMRRVASMETAVREVVVEHIERIRQAGSADLLSALATPVPAITIALLLGMPAPAWAELKDITNRAQDAAIAGDTEAGRKAAAELGQVVQREIDDRRENPKDDITSAIVHAEIGGERIDPRIAFAMVQIIVVAGFDTTVYGIGSLLHRLATDPDLQARVRAGDRTLRDHVIEESLRIESPVFGLARSVITDSELGGCPMTAGDRLLLCYSAANHDPAVFERPEEFDPERPNLSKHLAFGSGRHRCIGEHLAKMEIRVALDELLDRVPTFSLTPGTTVGMKTGNTRGPLSLPVVW